MTPLENALILSYVHADQLRKNLDVALLEMKAMNDPRAGKFQSLLEKLTGAANRAFATIEKNLPDKEGLKEELWDMTDRNWEKI